MNLDFQNNTHWSQVFYQIAKILVNCQTILDERPSGLAIPKWAIERGWVDYLSQLSETAVSFGESSGFSEWLRLDPSCPNDLRELGALIRNVVSIPSIDAAEGPLNTSIRSASERKQAQVKSFVSLIKQVVGDVGNAVDVGSGHGHLTRELAHCLGVPVIGIERSRHLVERAQKLAEESQWATEKQNRANKVNVEFEQMNVMSSEEIIASGKLKRGGLTLGLHACGGLADEAILAAGQIESNVAFVSCCLQKIMSEQRCFLSTSLPCDCRPILRRHILGLSNMTPRENGVEASYVEMIEARRARVCLRELLLMRGCVVGEHAEMHGLNRRVAYGDFETLANAALKLRNLPTVSQIEISEAKRRGTEVFEINRRFNLPRQMLARVVELFVVLDRAMSLVDRGQRVEIVQVFSSAVSPRNVGLVSKAS